MMPQIRPCATAPGLSLIHIFPEIEPAHYVNHKLLFLCRFSFLLLLYNSQPYKDIFYIFPVSYTHLVGSEHLLNAGTYIVVA